MAITRFAAADPQDNTVLTWATVAPASGDLVLLLWANDGGDDQTGLANFTRLNNNSAVQTGVELGIYYRVCTGSESGNIFTDETSFGVTLEEYAWHAFKIPAAEWHGTPGIAISSAHAASTGTPDPPACTPSWGAEAGTVFFVVVTRDDDDGITAAPTNYATNFVRSIGGSLGPEIATSWRVPSPAVASEDPGVWTVTGTAEEFLSFTFAVRPAVVGTVVLDTGTVVGAGADALASGVIALDIASLALASADLTVSNTIVVQLDQGAASTASNDLSAAANLALDTAPASVAGSDIESVLVLTLDTGSGVLAGEDISVIEQGAVVLDTGSVTVIGDDLQIDSPQTIALDQGSVDAAGADANAGVSVSLDTADTTVLGEDILTGGEVLVLLDSGAISVLGGNVVAAPDVAWQEYVVEFAIGQQFEVEFVVGQMFEAAA